MEIRDVLTNIKKYDAWDYKNYPLRKEEADAIVETIENEVRPKGKWIYTNGNSENGIPIYKCSFCKIAKVESKNQGRYYQFCFICGADMTGRGAE